MSRASDRRALRWVLALACLPLANFLGAVLLLERRGGDEPAERRGASGAGRRCLAALADFAVVYALLLVPGAGWCLAAGYGLFRDSLLPGGRSPGKRLLGLEVSGAGGRRLPAAVSLRRNALVGLPVVQLVGIPLEAVIIVLSGRRLGDRLAGTDVVRSQEER